MHDVSVVVVMCVSDEGCPWIRSSLLPKSHLLGSKLAKPAQVKSTNHRMAHAQKEESVSMNTMLIAVAPGPAGKDLQQRTQHCSLSHMELARLCMLVCVLCAFECNVPLSDVCVCWFEL